MFVITLRQQLQPVQINRIPTQKSRQKLIIGNVLSFRYDNPSSMLEQLLIVPMGIQNSQSFDNPVMLPHENRVYSRQSGLFRCPSIPRDVTETGRRFTFGMVVALRQQFLAFAGDSAVHSSTITLQFPQDTFIFPVDLGAIQKRGVLVDLLAWAQSLLSGQGSHERHAHPLSGGNVHFGVVVVT